MALLLKGHSEHINVIAGAFPHVIVRQRRTSGGRSNLILPSPSYLRRDCFVAALLAKTRLVAPFFHVIALLFYVIASPSAEGRGNLSVLCEIPTGTRRLPRYARNDMVSLCTYEHAEIAEPAPSASEESPFSLHSSQ